MATKKNKRAISVADIVRISDKKHAAHGIDGVVRYIGNIRNKTGIWYGIALNRKNRKIGATNGTFNDIQYFKCDNYTAIFVQKKQINLESAKKKATKTHKEYKIGQQVSVNTVLCNGIIKSIFTEYETKTKSTTYYGIKLDSKLGDTNGKYNNIQYFQCKMHFGIFAAYKNLGDPYIEYDKNELLVSGYINQVCDDEIYFTKSLIYLCIDYFYSSGKLYNHIMFLCRCKRSGALSIKAIGIKMGKDIIKKQYDFKFKDPNKLKSNDWSRIGRKYAVTYNIHPNLQNYICDRYRYKQTVNSMILYSSIDNKEHKNAKMIFFNSNDVNNNNNNIINGLIHKNIFERAPSNTPKQKYFDGSITGLIYDNFNNFILMYGCGSKGQPIWYSNLNKLKRKNNNIKIGWNLLDIPMINLIYSPCLEIMNARNKQYFIHGRDKMSFSVTIISDKKSKIVKLSEYKIDRSNRMCCKMKNKNKIIVGGECKEKQCEIYDIIKNKWTVFKPKYNFRYTQDFHICGNNAMWIDSKFDNNIVFMSGNIGQLRPMAIQPIVEYIDLRENKKKWNTIEFGSLFTTITAKYCFY